ncbi:hypothetical protein AYI70_g1332 [Smittium culicis]|uniref:Uncharacterized protein n=1 Tax=Smittium culicis TaxID=133412 RepID=A0A1R1YD30_9FUNG|nr:hypothetical protein AYI70_g10596 [Smittium culicis]OMJ24799.1 hypothetical protein AYI70_g1332 [Smittium culicis]
MTKFFTSITALVATLSQLLVSNATTRTANIQLYALPNNGGQFFNADYKYDRCFNTSVAVSMNISVSKKSTMIVFKGPDCKGRGKRRRISGTLSVPNIASKYNNNNISFVITRKSYNDNPIVPMFDYLGAGGFSGLSAPIPVVDSGNEDDNDDEEN